MNPVNNAAGPYRFYQDHRVHPTPQPPPPQQAKPSTSPSSKLEFSKTQIDSLKNSINTVAFQNPSHVDLLQMHGKINACIHYHKKAEASLENMNKIRHELSDAKKKLAELNGRFNSSNQQLAYHAQGRLQLNPQQIHTLQQTVKSLSESGLELNHKVGTLNRAGTNAAVSFDKALGARSLVGEADLFKLNMNDPSMARKFKNFIRELDLDSYNKRWDNLPRNQAVPGEDSETWLVLMHNEKIIGCTDFSPALDYKKSAVVNIIIDKKYHGSGVSKGLFEARNENLKKSGYAYQIGNVYDETNASHIEKLKSSGWHETKESIDFEDDLRSFWKAIDDRYANIPPKYDA
ncbi:hypothetical protein A7J50_6025 (plasmid) [Pseudomonas antarctica]|uniref:N-acetyltransferase domain-containing protein n=1 Tax=Pseudomonas antarctica TaxID=219572 RepID=A0A172Z9Y0_9PSED|nr:GNAT family N-acetyltransferase [Pseudomonas antarctica]ANF89317.1 hypothetical protein A7J50_6025 [Pseudomonas antarctica]